MDQEVLSAIRADDVGRLKSALKGKQREGEEMCEYFVSACEMGFVKVAETIQKWENGKMGNSLVNYRRKPGLETALHMAARNKHLAMVEHLLKSEGIDVFAGDLERSNPLMSAACGGNVDVLKAILTKMQQYPGVHDPINLKDGNGNAAFMWAVEKNQLPAVEFLHEKAHADINKENNSKATPLIVASKRGHTDIVKYLRDQNAKCDERDEYKRTALMVAKTKEIEELLSPNTDKKGYRSVELMQASSHGHFNKVRELLDKERDRNFQDVNSGFSALHKAIIRKHRGVVDLLLKDKEVDVNLQDHTGKTALMLAVRQKDLKLVESLLWKSKSKKKLRLELDPNMRDHQQTTALGYAIESKEHDIVIALLNAPSVDVNIKVCKDAEKGIFLSALEFACLKKCNEIDKELAHRDFHFDIAEVNRDVVKNFVKGINDNTHLFGGGSKKVFNLLLFMAEGTEIQNEETDSFWQYAKDVLNKNHQNKDEEGNSLLHYCAKQGSINLLEFLPESHFEKLHENKNSEGDTMLHTAMKNGRYDVFKVLMKRFNVKDSSKYVYRWLEKIFLAKNKDGNTVQSIAIKSPDAYDVVSKMFSNFQETQTVLMCRETDTGKNTILHLAVESDQNKLIEFLADKPVDMAAVNHRGYTPLILAVKKKKMTTVKVLFESFKHRNISINETMPDGETALHIAAKNGDAQMIKLLVKHGGDLAAQDEDGNTPLHDLLQKLHLENPDEDSRAKTFKTVWKAVVECCVTWRFKYKNKSIPDETSDRYLFERRNAMYKLRSEIQNKERKTVLEYGATLGLPKCVEIMLVEKNVFVMHQNLLNRDLFNEKGEKLGKDIESESCFFIEVSNLMPEFKWPPEEVSSEKSTDKDNTDKSEAHKLKTQVPQQVPPDEDNNNETSPFMKESADQNPKKGKESSDQITVRTKSFVETISEVNPPVKVSVQLDEFPMENLARYQWLPYQCIMYFLLILHIAVIVVYSVKSYGTIGEFPQENITFTSDIFYSWSQYDMFIMTYAGILFMLFMYALILIQVYDKYKKKERDDEADTKLEVIEHEQFSEFIETKGALLNYVTFGIAHIVEYLDWVIFFSFILCCFLVGLGPLWIASLTLEHYAWIKGIVILTGFLLFLAVSKVYSPVYKFITALQFIFLKDMIPFLYVYVAVTCGFGLAIHLQFELLATEQYAVIKEMFLKVAGLNSDITDLHGISPVFQHNQFGSLFVEFLLVLYALTCIMILLKMLAGTMINTITLVRDKQGKGWKQYQLRQALLLRRMTHGFFDRCVHIKAKSKQHSKTKRWYLPIRRRYMKKIRGQYWSIPTKEMGV